MKPSTLKQSASNTNSLVGFEIEGIFNIVKQIPLESIKTYQQFRQYFTEHTYKQTMDNQHILKRYIGDELIRTQFNNDDEQRETPTFFLHVEREHFQNELKWWDQLFDEADSVEWFIKGTYYRPCDYVKVEDGVVSITRGSNSDESKRNRLMELVNATKFGKHIEEVVADGSIDVEDREWDMVGMEAFPAEIVTKPIPYSEAISFITEFFEYLQTEFKFATNHSTGFHINVSNDNKDKLDMFKLFLFLGEKHELEIYMRSENIHAKPQFNNIKGSQDEPNIEETIELANQIIKQTDKYNSFNINHWEGEQYIEFRIAGGTDYQKGISTIVDSINRYVTVLDIATNSNKCKKEYYKKVALFMRKYKPDSPKLLPDTLPNAQYNIFVKTGVMLKPDSPVFGLSRGLQNIAFRTKSNTNKLILTPIENIFVKQMTNLLNKQQKQKATNINTPYVRNKE